MKFLRSAPRPTVSDPDEAPEPAVEPVSITGDLWRLGQHRLLCGDSTKSADVQKVLGSVKPYLMITDPPFGGDADAVLSLRNGFLTSELPNQSECCLNCNI